MFTDLLHGFPTELGPNWAGNPFDDDSMGMAI
jgi:hypothetical protein